MVCRVCGTEIADKALICFRCGTPTSAPAAGIPVRKRPSRVPGVLAALALIVLIAAALFLGQAGQLHVPPAVSYTVATLAALVLVIRLWVRRRR